MKNVSKFLWVITLVVAGNTFAQSTSEKLKKEQSNLEKKISNTRSLLDKTKNNAKASLNELRLIDNQIRFREELVSNFDQQVRGAEVKVIRKDAEVKELSKRLVNLKEQYRQLLLYAYKHRNKFGKLMYLFSATSYNEAIKRGTYLERIADIQLKQFRMIRQHQSLISKEISSIQQEKEYKLKILNEKRSEKSVIEKDKRKQEEVYRKFKQEESKLLSQLKDDEKKKENLKQKINSAIQNEIADTEAKRKKTEAEKAKKSTTTTTTSGTSTTTATKPESSTTTTKKETTLPETKESAALSKSFEGNKGKLPWPVDKGSITESFGRNAHPTLENVFTNNNGVDISASKGASVRAVFEGEVTSVLNIPGAGKVVIIKHGNYRTVYSNLQDTYVKIGSKVTTKQAIGTLLVTEGLSVAHFEIHQVVGTSSVALNPSLWITH
ncbi:MAG: peptidoglycan DD-metalloendopeptidase family protein [Cryomorphaceae bacterium]|jgi:septal ring factor EnvC (AmiA/AmiB activator)|nr:peptidoglycan DD-metalloendopeptidase family protein [Cryomorphaceae bacterium]